MGSSVDRKVTSSRDRTQANSDATDAIPSVSVTTADDILRAIRRIVQGITIHSKQLYRQTGLTVPQLLCLRAIAEAGDEQITAAQVSRSIRIGPATVTGILDRLERSDLIRRERRSRDRRKISLVLTAKGKERLATRSLQDRLVSRVMALDEPSRQNMLNGLERVVEMIDASSIEAAPVLASGDLAKETLEE
jgi:DNA-binding MarR family transcriptional regulator